ncbi:hypothetical protein CVU75_00685 [Candidatus Dependentiae bacterium HGW-Dependentiae-1]|nr:MAG: hypothetical protein CVU75_00685 [Candidatus Dependentiae bacterium HGW-Dependentiae-1]
MQLTKNTSRFFTVMSLLIAATLCAEITLQADGQNSTQCDRVYLIFGPNLDIKGVIAKNNAEAATITGLNEACFENPSSENVPLNNLILTSIADPLEAYPVCEQEGIAGGLALFSAKYYVVVSVLAGDAARLSELISAQAQTLTPEAATTGNTEIETLSELVTTQPNAPVTETAATGNTAQVEQLSELVATQVNEPIIVTTATCMCVTQEQK